MKQSEDSEVGLLSDCMQEYMFLQYITPLGSNSTKKKWTIRMKQLQRHCSQFLRGILETVRIR